MDTEEKKPKRPKGIVTIVISVIALAASTFSLYESYLRPGRIDIAVSEDIEFYYVTPVILRVILSFTISNDGARSAAIQKFALLIQQPKEEGGHILKPRGYVNMTGKGDIEWVSSLAPVTILSRNTEIKHILFESSREHPDESLLTSAGTYNLTLLVWSGESLRPKIADSFSIVLSEQNLASLEEQRKKDTKTTEVVPLSRWTNWQPRSITESELTELLRAKGKE